MARVSGIWTLYPLASQAQDLPYAREGAMVGGGFTYAIEQFDFDEVEDATGEDFDAADGAAWISAEGIDCFRTSRWKA